LAVWLRPDPLEELTALPRTRNWIKGSLLLRKGDGREWSEGKKRTGGEGSGWKEGV